VPMFFPFSAPARFTALALLPVSLAFAQWNLATGATSADLRAIYNVAGDVIWASGANGAVLRSEDEGYMWQECSVPPGAAKLDFRAIAGWDANRAVVMSIGSGAASRLYETTDGCATWHLLFENPDPAGFWVALLFRGNSGFILGNPIAGRFVFYRSDDKGRHWHRANTPGLAALPGERVFAAGNSSLIALPNSTLLFTTGGAHNPRIFRLSNSVKGHWKAAEVPFVGSSDGTGIVSIAFRDNNHGVAVGGDNKAPAKTDGTAAWTADGGASWHAARAFPSGYRSSVAWDQTTLTWIAVGPSGSDLSRDDGRTWQHFDSASWNALSLPWIAGPNGHIASLDTVFPAFAKKSPNTSFKSMQQR
jgi:photosystem II stability/assembly factor-like uncharacterized protein